MSRVYKCAVQGCDDMKSPRHYFPNPEKFLVKFRSWLDTTGNLSLQSLPYKTIYTSHRICQRHFAMEFITRNNRLTPTAIPQLYLPLEKSNSSNQERQTLLTNVDIIPEEFDRNIIDTIPIPTTVLCDAQPSTSSVLDTILTDLSNQERQTLLTNVDIIPEEFDQNIIDTIPIPTTALCDAQPSTSSVLDDTPQMERILQKHKTIRTRTQVSCPSTPKRSKYFMVSKISSPQKMRLYKELKTIRKRLALHKCRNLSFKKRLLLAEKTANSEAFGKAELSPIVANFFKSQARNFKKKPKGRRFSMDDKVMALSLIKQSGKGYRLLSKIFSLPTRKTLMATLKHICINPGINDVLFHHIQDSIKNLKSKDRLCTLIFDEMSLQQNLHWNHNRDVVEGFEDSGFGRTQKITDHVQVFMIRGIFKTWKQPVLYSFCESTTNTALLLRTLKEVIRRVHSTGLQILATVCDQGATNVAAINSLIATTKGEYLRRGHELRDRIFEIDGRAIIPLFDPPHLLKGIRNNFLGRNISFLNSKNERCCAKWQHIVDAYKIDAPAGRLRIMKKLTDFHVIPSKIKKMKVCYCSQVFSHQVASGISLMSSNKIKSADGKITMETTGIHTAELLLFFNDLFDSINGGTLYPSSGVLLRCAVTKESRHLKFWNNAIQKLHEMYFVDCQSGQKSIPPSLRNWIVTLQGFKKIHEIIQDSGHKYFLPRAFNQDPIENYFGQIRQHGACYINPSCTAFGNYFKSLLIMNFISTHSIGSNCESDNTTDLLLSVKNFMDQNAVPVEDSNVDAAQLTENFNVDRDIENAGVGFVSGFIIKHALERVENCENCKRNFITEPTRAVEHMLIREREYDTNARLLYCNPALFNMMKCIYNVTINIFPSVIYKKFVFKRILETIKQNVEFISISNCSIHSNDKLVSFIVAKFIRLLIHNYVNGLNNVLMGRDSRNSNEDDIYKYCRKRYLKTVRH